MLYMGVRSLLLAFALASLACKPIAKTSNPDLATAVRHKDVLEMERVLEEMVDAKAATDEEREYAYKQLERTKDDGSAAYALARAGIVGRYAESKGLKALWLIKEIEGLALESIARDPDFEDAAARRMLGTLYVLAGDHTEKGDSEVGLELLEELVDGDAENPRNRLRLAEGYIFLGDPDPALEHLCFAHSKQDELRPSEQRLLKRLFGDVGGIDEAGCGG